MEDDKTVFKPWHHLPKNTDIDSDKTVFLPASEQLTVELCDETGKPIANYSFTTDFSAGRDLNNHIVINSKSVSRHHAEIKKENGAWWVYDLNSVNGTYIQEQRIQHKTKLDFPVIIALGVSGIQLSLKNNAPSKQTIAAKEADPHHSQSIKPLENAAQDINPATRKPMTEANLKSRLLCEQESDDFGDYTRIVRRLIREDRVKRGNHYKKSIWVLVILCLMATALVAYQQIALSNTKKIALDMFYDIKTLEVSLAQADIKLEDSYAALDKTIRAITAEKLKIEQDKLKLAQEQLEAEKKRMILERARLSSMKEKYQQYVKEANALRFRLPTRAENDREIIAKVARELGESELELPDEFVEEVSKYIQYWQKSSRMQKAMETLEKNNYLPIILSALQREGLPIYFLYLPLQESNYNTLAIGPETRYGVAKGAWQLLASTAQDYGLTPGPLANSREYDPQDARFDFDKATQAGTKYLKRIYSTQAQASGLLVMASYNYGDTRVRNMIKRMPDNPRDKNFWKFIQQYELPKETHDYVFYIFAAAVIGENPEHFGFKFNSALFVQEAATSSLVK